MAFDIMNTHHLLAAYEQAVPVSSFLRDRYFPCNPSTDIFGTDDVIMEFRDGTQRLAPFVAPRVGGKTVMRNGYTMERYEPPFIAPRRPLTVDELQKKGFGEAIYANLTPDQRQGAIATKDMSELDTMITRREEAMAAQVMTTNALTMRHYGDNDSDYEEKVIHYYAGESNPAVYTITNPWDEANADIFSDLDGMITLARQHGLAPTELVVASNVVPMILNDTKVQTSLDNKRFELGNINPVELNKAGAAWIGVLNVNGVLINIISYAAQYEGDDGNFANYIPADTVILTAPGAGRTAYGAVTQLESDEQFHTYAAKRVPKMDSFKARNLRELTLQARPLLMPNEKYGFIVADVS